jgi:hypothetical protein
MVSRRLSITDEARPWRNDQLQLGVEASPIATDFLRARGANLLFRTHHLAGPLPAEVDQL